MCLVLCEIRFQVLHSQCMNIKALSVCLCQGLVKYIKKILSVNDNWND